MAITAPLPWRLALSKGGHWRVYDAKDNPVKPDLKLNKKHTKEEAANLHLIVMAVNMLGVE